jgi:hypothetical protein
MGASPGDSLEEPTEIEQVYRAGGSGNSRIGIEPGPIAGSHHNRPPALEPHTRQRRIRGRPVRPSSNLHTGTTYRHLLRHRDVVGTAQVS